MGFLGDASGKEHACQCKRFKRLGSLGWEDPLEEGTATDSSILGWRIPWTEEPGRRLSMGSAKSWTQPSDYHFHFHGGQWIGASNISIASINQ